MRQTNSSACHRNWQYLSIFYQYFQSFQTSNIFNFKLYFSLLLDPNEKLGAESCWMDLQGGPNISLVALLVFLNMVRLKSQSMVVNISARCLIHHPCSSPHSLLLKVNNYSSYKTGSWRKISNCMLYMHQYLIATFCIRYRTILLKIRNILNRCNAN